MMLLKGELVSEFRYLLGRNKGGVMDNSGYKIIWLEDEQETIGGLTKYLQERGNFIIKVFEESEKALDALYSEKPDLFIVDLLLQRNGRRKRSATDGLSVAKTAWIMKPEIPIIAITEYLNRFSQGIALSLAKQQYPFVRLWEKEQLETEEAKKAFLEQLRFLCQLEYHLGKVTEVEDDYMQVTLRNTKGEEYIRFFETEFLKACGIGKAGEELGILFWKEADGVSGEVHMRLTRLPLREDTLAAELREIISRIDLEKIKEKFRPPGDNS